MLWFHCLLAAAILGFAVWSRRREWRREFIWGGVVLIALCCLAAAAAWPDLLYVQKTLTALAMPCGLIWLLLVGATVLGWQRRRAWLWNVLSLLLLYTLAGNNVVVSVLTAWLQQPFAAIDPLDAGDFEAIVVLGGGASERPGGYMQVNGSGDRVVLAARLYHAGRTPILVAAGNDPSWLRSRAVQFDEPTRVIWRQLRIPDDAMTSMFGRNTREEIIALHGLVEERQWRRVGLITSAWHMRRAMRLARTHEVAVDPLPADFRGGEVTWSSLSLIPDGGSMRDIQFGVKELLAMAVGR